MKHILYALAFLFLSGCDPLGIEKAADALDRFRETIDKTTQDGGDLDKRIAQVSNELRNLIKDAKDAGKEITEDVVLKFALARAQTIRDILDLSNKLKLDVSILRSEFQGMGVSIPLQLEDSLKAVQGNLKEDVATIIAALNIIYTEKNFPLEHTGLNWSLRPTGFHVVSFQIKDAPSLRLKIGDQMIPPENPKAGSVTYRIPFMPKDDALFDDTREAALGFQLVDVTNKQGKEAIKFRYGGTFRLQPRFPLKYEFKVFPAGGDQLGETRTIDQGPAIMHLLNSVSNKDVRIVAGRHGDIYREAKSRLAIGASFAQIPKGAHWELKVWFPDGSQPVILSPGLQRKENKQFGTVTVSGPNQKGQEWSLLVDVELDRR